VLFDEVEKAHPDVRALLLQIMDEGKLSDAEGNPVDFRNTVVVMTSNLGAEAIRRDGAALGFAPSGGDRDAALRAALKTCFSEEFLGRLDAIVPFRLPDKEDRRRITQKLLEELCGKLAQEGRSLCLEEAVTDYLLEKWQDDGYGVRTLRHLIGREVADPLTELLRQGRWKGQACIRVEEGCLRAEA
jgi:ATP-dependent Clp protease ATP-binding subunit ClpA